MVEKNVILAGLGPHARRIYYPLLEKYSQQYGISVPLVIDLQDQQDTARSYLAGRALQPGRVFFAHPRNRNGGKLDDETRSVLEETASRCPIHGIIISTEPKAHKPYALWAMERDLHILMDKPLTAPVGLATDPDAPRRILDDYREMAACLRRSGSNMIVQCQRRSHAGYRFVRNYLAEFVGQFGIPISYIDIYHADGMWCMPHELFHRENHPYKYGYGKLLHSGYHFVDLFVWLSEVNRPLQGKRPSRADLYVKRFGAYDHLHQVGADDYRRLFGTDQFAGYLTPDQRQVAQAFGELDVFALCQLKRDDVVVTTGSINLQQNSFCRRSWLETPEDVYKGNGRIRHERLNVQVGNLLNVQIHSYQSYEVGKKDVETSGAGDEDHFDVLIFRNSGVVGGEPLEKFSVGEAARRLHQGEATYLGHNENAREANLLLFLEGRSDGQDLWTHSLTNHFLSKFYECIVRENRGRVPHVSFHI